MSILTFYGWVVPVHDGLAGLAGESLTCSARLRPSTAKQDKQR